MTRIVVAAKQDKILLQDSQAKTVSLDQPAIIQIGVTQQDVKTLERLGDKLIISLNNGEQIVLEGFFQANSTTTHSLTFPKADGSFSLAHFDANGKFTDYSGLQKLDTLLYEGANTAAVQQVSAYEDSTPEFSFSNLFSSSAVKAGVGLVSAIGLGLALIDNGGSNQSKGITDIIAPKTPTATLNAEGTEIKGTAEAGATIYVIDKNQKVIATAVVDKDGNYSLTLPEALLNNNTYYINAKDKAGNASTYTSVVGTKDTIAPNEPQGQLNEQGNIVTGKAEANATINVYDPAGQLIGTAKANAQGQFSVAISPALTTGQIGTVEAIDASGNKSEKHNIEVGKDTIAPDQPKFEVSKEGNSIHGTAEANAKVIIQDSTGVVIATGTVDANGKFNITISPALDASKTGKIIIEDAAGNKSSAVEIKAGQDVLAPDKPVANLNAEGTVITGTAEANSKISVYDSANKLLGTATTDANGNYSVTLSTALTEAKVGSVYATDAAGNQSALSSVTGTKDVTAPASPKITDVVDDVGATVGSVAANGTTDDKRPVISGTGEAGATLIIYDNNQAIGTVTVGADSKWSYSFAYDLTLGSHSITTVQTDKAGNTSLVSDARTFTVVEIAAKMAVFDEASAFHADLADSNINSAKSADAIGSGVLHSEPESSAQVFDQSTPIENQFSQLHSNVSDVDHTAIAGSSAILSTSIATVLQDGLENTKVDDIKVDNIKLANTNSYDSTAISVDELLAKTSVNDLTTNQIDDVLARTIDQSATTVVDDAKNTELFAFNKAENLSAQDIPVLQSDLIKDLFDPQLLTF
ncbi:Ig-like repeat protein Blp2 [Acinetobacter sp. CE-15]|uniref:Ig-like repeat protein Blp2 n=1 Tax=Acinetobacter sp. CE-15 TaxID=3425693 RepID=UPI003DA41AE7